jgi:hypothetical protein
MNPEGAAARIRAVLDTNIYIAAFAHPDGPTAKQADVYWAFRSHAQPQDL